MNHFTLLAFVLAFLLVSQSSEAKPTRKILQGDWEKVLANPHTPWQKVQEIRNGLFANIVRTDGGYLTAGGAGMLSWANREWIGSLVRAGRYKRAAGAMRAHVDFCEKEDAGLYGRYWPNWIEFVQLHARVWAELGYDPLKGRNLYYQLTEDRLGYHAFTEQDTLGKERNTEIGQITWGAKIPADETIGECVLMNTIGKMTSHEYVGLAFPSTGPSLGKRVRSIYVMLEDKSPLHREDASTLLSARR